MKTWDVDEALQSLTPTQEALIKDTNLSDSTQVAEMVNGLFRQHAAEAALSIVQIALHGSNERMRFSASQYVIDMATSSGGEDDPLTSMVGELTQLLRGSRPE